MSRVFRAYPAEFKVSACERMETTESVAALARELGLRRATLYLWRAKYRSKGSPGLRGRGRPSKSAPPPELPPPELAAPPDRDKRIAELERKIGQQALELDFFRAALQRVRGARR